MKTIILSNNKRTAKAGCAFFIFLFFIVAINNKIDAQTYREQFDKLDQQIFSSDEFLNQSNFAENLHNVTSSLMRSYITMYRATSDLKYLNKFIITSKRVMDRRDDNWYHIKNHVTGFNTSGCLNFSGCAIFRDTVQIPLTSKGWSRILRCNLQTAFMETGTITCPMAEFILLLQEHPELYIEPLPAEALSTKSEINSYGEATVLTFKQYADWLRNKVCESLDWEYNNHWNNRYGFFGNTQGGAVNGATGINQQAALGKTFLLMYKASVNDGRENTVYKTVAQCVATHVYDAIHDEKIGNLPVLANGAPWYAWCHIYGCASGWWEDITHSFLEIEMIKEMVDKGIPASNGIYFSIADMQKFANGFLYRVCAIPKTAAMNVYGTSDLNSCYGVCDGTPDNDYYQAGGLVFLSDYNPGVYQAVSDIYSPNQKINGIINSVFYPNGANGKAMFGLSQLVYYENLFNPITVKSNTGTHSYMGSASGDFDGDGQDDFASLNTVAENNVIQTYRIINDTISLAYSCNMAGVYRYLAAGNIIVSSLGDELASIDIKNNELVLFKKQGNMLVPVSRTNISGGNDSFAGLAVGEFNSSYCGKEIMINVAQGESHLFKMYGYDPAIGTLVEIPLSSNTTNTLEIGGFTVGDFDGNGVDEIAMYSNLSTDTPVKIFSVINGNRLQNVSDLKESNLNASCNGIASGDFDGNGVDELILHKQLSPLDGAFQTYDISSGFVKKGEEVFPLIQGNGIMCKLKLAKHPLSDAVVTFRNFDGQISVFNLNVKN